MYIIISYFCHVNIPKSIWRICVYITHKEKKKKNHVYINVIYYNYSIDIFILVKFTFIKIKQMVIHL